MSCHTISFTSREESLDESLLDNVSIHSKWSGNTKHNAVAGKHFRVKRDAQSRPSSSVSVRGIAQRSAADTMVVRKISNVRMFLVGSSSLSEDFTDAKSPTAVLSPMLNRWGIPMNYLDCTNMKFKSSTGKEQGQEEVAVDEDSLSLNEASSLSSPTQFTPRAPTASYDSQHDYQ
jgi:hypothetical protein